MAGVLAEGFLAIEAERPHHRQIVEVEQAGVLGGRGIAVLVEGPGRHAEDVALFPIEALAVDDGIAFTLGHLVNGAAGVAVGARLLARAQHLHGGADGLHHRPAGLRIDVVHQDAVERRAVGRLGVFGQRLVGRRPFVFQERRIGLVPVAAGRLQPGRAPRQRGVVDRVGHGLLQVGMDGVEIGFQRVDQRDVEAVLPDAGAAVRGDAVLVPAAVRREHEVVFAERHLVAVDDGVGADAFHDETQRRGRMPVRRGDLARLHHLQPGIEPAAGGRDVPAAGVVEVDHPAAGLFRRHQIERAQHVRAQVGVAPQHRHGGRFRLPGLDLVGDRPKGRGVEPLQVVVIGQQVGGILDIGAAGHVLAVVFPGRSGHGRASCPAVRILSKAACHTTRGLPLPRPL